MEVSLISRKTGKVVATGVGAATMLETKYKYRWESFPEDFGYAKEGLRKKKDGDYWKYRILNPEISELINTITKMCAKRGEVDGSQNLPGVSSALQKLKLKKKLGSGTPANVDTSTGEIGDPPDWNHFWGATSQMGLSPDQVHAIVGCKSLVEWVQGGGKLSLALEMCRNEIIKEKGKGQLDDVTMDEPEAEEGIFTEEPVDEEPVEKLIQMDISKITTKTLFARACFKSFDIQQGEAIKLTGTTVNNIADWGDAFLQVAGALGYRVIGGEDA
jgi:hypothetical protein